MPLPDDLLMGRYRILERLGSGGMATVHRARDERLDRDVAVKILLPNLAGDPQTAARFEREARSLAASSHPGIVAVFDVDAGDPATGREPFFVMELCRGGSLADRLGPGRAMAPDELIPIVVSVADGLADLHRRGIVHRDVKPQNILFADDRPKLADFGLAQTGDGEGVSELTTPGTTVGTLAYLAPEVLAGERATSAADVYAFGVVAYVGLTGRPPRPSSSMAELVATSRSVAPTVSTVAPHLGPAFDGPIGAALALRPGDRPDAVTLASGLAGALGRWTRDGGPARMAAAPDPGSQPGDDGSLVAIARPGRGRPGADADVTTAMAVPLGATAALPSRPAEGVAAPRSAPSRTPSRARVSWLTRATVAAGLLLVAMVALVNVLGLVGMRATGSAAPSGIPTRASAGAGSPSAAPSASASAAPSASSTVAPTPTPDPARAALRALESAIAAARGGPDGLKGKDANDLEKRVAEIAAALDRGDRAKALDLARKLDGRIGDLGKVGAGLRDESAALVRALGG